MLICFYFILYILPTLIAILRGHRNHNSIAIVNLLLGWTGLAWIIALSWSFSSNVKHPRRKNYWPQDPGGVGQKV